MKDAAGNLASAYLNISLWRMQYVCMIKSGATGCWQGVIRGEGRMVVYLKVLIQCMNGTISNRWNSIPGLLDILTWFVCKFTWVGGTLITQGSSKHCRMAPRDKWMQEWSPTLPNLTEITAVIPHALRVFAGKNALSRVSILIVFNITQRFLLILYSFVWKDFTTEIYRACVYFILFLAYLRTFSQLLVLCKDERDYNLRVETICDEIVVACFKIISWYVPGGTEEKHETAVDSLSLYRVQTVNIPNTKLDSYPPHNNFSCLFYMYVWHVLSMIIR
jgi:hypothetical protein